MKFIYLLLTFFLWSNWGYTQESNHAKRMWAKSILNEKAPKLVVEEWVSDKPDLKDKFVLIDFWATWCGPCRRAIPHLNAFHRKFGDKLVVIGISDETKEKIKSMINPQIEYFSAIDSEKRIYNKLEIQGIPHCILISPAGKVIWEGYPLLQEHPLTEKVIEDLLVKYQQP